MLVLLLILFFNFGGYAFPPKSHSPDSDPALPNDQHIHPSTDGIDNALNTQGLPGIEDSSSAVLMIPNAETDESDYQKKNGADGVEPASSLEIVTSGQVDAGDDEPGAKDDLTNKVYNSLEEAKAAAEEMEQRVIATTAKKEQDKKRLLEVEEDVRKLTSRLQNLTEEENEKKDQQMSTNTSITTKEEELREMKERLQNADEEIKNATEDFEDAKKKFEDADEEQATKKRQLVEMENGLELLQSELESLGNKSAGLKTEKKRLKTRVSALKTEISTASKQMEKANVLYLLHKLNKTDGRTDMSKDNLLQRKIEAEEHHDRLMEKNRTLSEELQSVTANLSTTTVSLNLKEVAEESLNKEVRDRKKDIQKKEEPLEKLEKGMNTFNKTLIELSTYLNNATIAKKEAYLETDKLLLELFTRELKEIENEKTTLTADPLFGEQEQLTKDIMEADSVILRYKAGAEWARKEVSRLTLLAPPLSTGDPSADSVLPPTSSIGDWFSNNWLYFACGAVIIVVAALVIALIVCLVTRNKKTTPADPKTAAETKKPVQTASNQQQRVKKTEQDSKITDQVAKIKAPLETAVTQLDRASQIKKVQQIKATVEMENANQTATDDYDSCESEGSTGDYTAVMTVRKLSTPEPAKDQTSEELPSESVTLTDHN